MPLGSFAGSHGLLKLLSAPEKTFEGRLEHAEGLVRSEVQHERQILLDHGELLGRPVAVLTADPKQQRLTIIGLGLHEEANASLVFHPS